jgi:hypothetical protein
MSKKAILLAFMLGISSISCVTNPGDEKGGLESGKAKIFEHESPDVRKFVPFFLPADDEPETQAGNRALWLEAHNEARAALGIRMSPLVWDKKLRNYAKQWARHLAAKGCKLEHSRGSGFGENLAANWGSGSWAKPRSPDQVVGMWTKEEQWYNYNSNKCQPGKMCGHYTQVVWANTSKVGCAQAKGVTDKGMTCYVYSCNYYKPGNYVGQRPY